MSVRRTLLGLAVVALAILVPSASGRTRADVVLFENVGPAGANGAWVMSSGNPDVVIWSGLQSHPSARKHYGVVRSAAGLRAPLVDNAASHAAFWPPHDTLIDQADQTG